MECKHLVMLPHEVEGGERCESDDKIRSFGVNDGGGGCDEEDDDVVFAFVILFKQRFAFDCHTANLCVTEEAATAARRR
jgi:hypothetical protein